MGINTDIYVSRVNSSYDLGMTWIEILRRHDGPIYMPEKIRLSGFESRPVRERLRREWIAKRKDEGLRLQGTDEITKLTRMLCYDHFEPGDPYDSLDAVMAAVKNKADGFFLTAEGFHQSPRFLPRQQFLNYPALAMAEKVEQRAVLAARRKIASGGRPPESRPMGWRATDLIVLPRHTGGVHGIGGVDHGAERLVLVRRRFDGETRDLQWRKGFDHWESVLHPKVYQPTTLLLSTHRDGELLDSRTELHEGGRLSHALVNHYAAAIDAFFGTPVADQILLTQTLVWTQ